MQVVRGQVRPPGGESPTFVFLSRLDRPSVIGGVGLGDLLSRIVAVVGYLDSSWAVLGPVWASLHRLEAVEAVCVRADV